MALQLKRVSCRVTMVPYCERRTHVARCCMDSICLILGNGVANGQTRPTLKTFGSTQQDCLTLLRLQNAETTQLDRSVAESSRLLVVPPSATNDRMIPSKVPRACSILEHQTDDRKFIKHYDYHSLRGKSSNLKLGSESTSPTADMGTTLLESRERQGTSRVLLERVETNVNFPEPCPLGVGLRRLPRAPLSCSH
jgi:hypothetical protein